MAVPPVPQARAAVQVRAVRVPMLVDVVIGLLTVVALPLAVVAIPNTISVVAALLPPGVSQVEMIRAHGLALPAMLVTVPIAAAAVRRFRAAPILVAGLTLLALADAAGGYTETVTLVGVLRVLHGIGAGMLVPATLAAVAERPRHRVLLPIWAGALSVSLLSAQALALWAIRDVSSWRVTLQPYPLLTGVALALAAVYLVLWMVTGGAGAAEAEGERQVLPLRRPTSAERGRLALAAVPAAAIAALGVGVTFDWPPLLVVAAAALATVAMLALAAFGAIEGQGGRTLALVNVAVGLVVLPTAAQMTYIELGGPLGGPGLLGLWVPFLVAGLAALAAAVLAGRAPETSATRMTAVGLAAVVGGMCAVRLLVPAPSGTPLVVPFVLLAAGAAVALVGAFRLAGLGSALLGLSLCFPAVLAGFLLGTGIQVNRLREAAGSAPAGRDGGNALVKGFVDALHMWALVGGFVVVGVIVLSSVLARRSAAAASAGQVVIPLPTPSPEGDDPGPQEPDTVR
ncbi:hypothetical protein DI270_026230 [Microbispora triticiradicis]|uniref:MFS transporter n=3 Tax=Microbispora TaxID=2005 RepID=A0ABY3LRL7_9ACTN|nr:MULTISPECIES: hypothetical protein [Microbispora]RGA02046.1 hypothetical protein DI270_026230 [Microbispora triticiradicis]TLP50802.1 hypothetical protein FED44_34825 [Microbispora fusca]TYB50431.1 hypothetical protein FXF59_28390 [Microbispora tritici]